MHILRNEIVFYCQPTWPPCHVGENQEYRFFLVDINECVASPSLCDADAVCINNEGSYQCSCQVGFTGDGATCNGV